MNAGGLESEAATPNPLLSVRDLHTYFDTYRGEAKAVRGVSFDLHSGQVLGIVGETGSGKSVTALSLVRLVRPPGRLVRGTVIFDGDDLTKFSDGELNDVRGSRISMVFQNPRIALNPLFTIRDQMFAVLDRHKPMPRKQREEVVLSWLENVGLSAPRHRLGQYPHELSTGMCQRIMIATALLCDPELLIADEPTTGVDVTLQAQILDLIRDLITRLSTAVVIITHDMGVVAETTEMVAVMYSGKIVEFGSTESVLTAPSHPYTRGLLAASLRVDRKTEVVSVRGVAPDLVHLPRGCSFNPRCDFAISQCREIEPEPRMLANGSVVACHRAEELPHFEDQ